MGHPSASERVAAVVVTFNRREVLREALNALLSQTVPLTVLVVDNGSGDSTGRMIEAEFPDVVYLGQADNLGPAGGFAVGVEEALRRGAAWVWLFNDDDRPSPDALAHLLERVGPGTEKPADLIGCWLRGEGGEILTRGVLWRSREVDIAAPAQGAAPYPADIHVFSGLLVSREVVETVGVPRREYFMMMEEIEYCLRARRHGFHLLMVPEPLVESKNLGSRIASTPPWKGYYQTRNHLVMALSHRSWPEVAWWAIRQVKFVVAAVAMLDRKATRVGFRISGAWDALRGRMGRRSGAAHA